METIGQMSEYNAPFYIFSVISGIFGIAWVWIMFMLIKYGVIKERNKNMTTLRTDPATVAFIFVMLAKCFLGQVTDPVVVEDKVQSYHNVPRYERVEKAYGKPYAKLYPVEKRNMVEYGHPNPGVVSQENEQNVQEDFVDND